MIARACASLLFGTFVMAGCLPTDMAPVSSAPPAEPAAAVAEAAAPEKAAVVEVAEARPAPDPELVAMYASRQDGDRMLPAVDVAEFHRELLRNRVDYPSAEPPGSVVIDTSGPFLYLVEGEGKATRYGIAIGREGFGWTGTGTIARRAQWPRWTPPPEMIARDPHLEKWKDGQPGGVDNPLGARALYIYFGGQDSGFRIHGTNTPRSIGWAASSGCFRMLNQDVIDLYDRVQMGAKVTVI
jgi:lipoprotein-anchoring transpeptidase ErfK/SrfK